MINKKQINLFEKYSKVRTAIDKLINEEKHLKDQILKDLDKSEKSIFGIFTPVVRVSYKYSKATQRLEKSTMYKINEYAQPLLEQVKEAKQHEEKKGTAKPTESKSMQFRGLK